MKVFLRFMMRFLRYDLRMASEWPQNGLRIDPPDHPPDWSPDDPPDPYIPTSDTSWSRIGVI